MAKKLAADDPIWSVATWLRQQDAKGKDLQVLLKATWGLERTQAEIAQVTGGTEEEG